MRYHTSSVELPYGWRETASAFWRKYPNSYAKHVRSEDVVLREVGFRRIFSKICVPMTASQVDGPVLRTVRVLTKTNAQPKWTERIIGKAQSSVVVVEESIVNALEQTLTTYTRNIGYYNDKFATVEERCVQTAVDAHATTLHKQVGVSSVPHECGRRGCTRATAASRAGRSSSSACSA